MALAEEWTAFVKYKDDQTRLQWNTVRTLVFCADQAVTNPDAYRNESKDALTLEEAIFAAIKDTPDFINGNEAKVSAWICIRTLLDAPSRRVEAPIAGWEKEKGESGGFIASFVLETLDKGGGQFVHHPIDTFCPLANKTEENKNFFASMQDAWKAAKGLAQKEGVSALFDGRWRLLKGGKPMTEASGRSASGAAAWGWYCALTGKVYDPRVIVLAQIDGDGNLTGVGDDGVRAKAKVIAASGRFDKIVVASKENQAEAESIVGKSGPIKVENLSDEK
jgi:hypothetical protein